MFRIGDRDQALRVARAGSACVAHVTGPGVHVFEQYAFVAPYIGDPRTNWGLNATPAGKEFGGYFHVTCPQCGEQRSIEFFETVDFRRRHPYDELGHETPSTIISAREFSVELERCLAGLREEFVNATGDELDAQGTFHQTAAICTNELLKFIPADLDEIPDSAFPDADLVYKYANRSRLTRTYLTEQRQRLRQLGDKMNIRATAISEERILDGLHGARRLPLPPFSLAALKLHEKWFFEGPVGENQPIIARGADAREMGLSARTLSKAIMEKVTLDRADLSAAQLDEALLTEVSFRGAVLTNGSATAARFTRCQLGGVDGTLWRVREATFDDCDLTAAVLARSVWTQATVTTCVFRDADLRNARLDEATFTDCDFRGADLRVVEPGINTARKARFVRCDLRQTQWEGRELNASR